MIYASFININTLTSIYICFLITCTIYTPVSLIAEGIHFELTVFDVYDVVSALLSVLLIDYF